MNLTETNKNKAFTLIELLVVIAIIAMLAAIILVATGSARARSRDARRVADLYQVQAALENQYDVTGSYPVSDCISSPWWNCWGAGDSTTLVPSTYLSVMPQDPSFYDNGAACSRPSTPPARLYSYYSDTGQRYILATDLENAPASSDQHYYTGTYGCTGYANWAIVKGF